ncbi:MAG: glycosyltransferase [Blastocatellia bacterium]|nr:glycosyltransferase [Blastocatellia bacterium]
MIELAQNQTEPVLSVVVIGRNEGARLVRCLESVRAMNSPGGPVEIIYVDSDSTDQSPSRAEELGARVLVVHPERPTAALGRNAGWRAARAEFVLFLDGDTILDPDFVGQAMKEFADPKVAVVWGTRREIHPEQSLYNRVLDLDWMAPVGPSQYCGGDALMRRKVLEEVGGYDQTLIAGEEPEMCRRMRAVGYVILHVDLPMTGHDLAMLRWAQYWRRATRTGYAYAEVSARFRGTDIPLWEAESRHNRRRTWLQIGLFLAGLAVSLWWLKPWPLLAVAAFYGLLIVRTTFKFRWKSPSLLTCFCYGVHSHIQQVPIFLGQLQYGKDARQGQKRGLIEYK